MKILFCFKMAKITFWTKAPNKTPQNCLQHPRVKLKTLQTILTQIPPYGIHLAFNKTLLNQQK